jgi:hypothetical protein
MDLQDNSQPKKGKRLRILDKLLELFAIGVERVAALGRHAAKGNGNFPAISFLDAYVTSLFQFRKMDGKVAFGQTGLALEV